MSEPEVKFEIDEYGRIGYRVTNEGVLLSKDEKEFIISHILCMQAEIAKLRDERTKLRELVTDMWRDRDALSYGAAIPTLDRMASLGIEVTP